MYENNNEVYDWDGEIFGDNSSDYIILPEGDYKFTVQKTERGNFNGSDKMPACHKITLTFAIHAPEGDVTINDQFFLCSIQKKKIASLHMSVGLLKRDETARMNWGAMSGLTGYCHVKPRNYKKKDGSDGVANDISFYYAYDEQPKNLRAAVQSNGWTAGAF